MKTWLSSSFFLPFRTTFEIDSLSGGLSERVQQNPINSNGKYSLYLKFSEATTYVLCIICIYRCQRYLQINSSRNCFKSHELEQWWPQIPNSPKNILKCLIFQMKDNDYPVLEFNLFLLVVLNVTNWQIMQKTYLLLMIFLLWNMLA